MPENETEIDEQTGDQETYLDSGVEEFVDESTNTEVVEDVEPQVEPAVVEDEEPAVEAAPVIAARKYTPAPLPRLFDSEEEEVGLREALGDDAFNAMVAITSRAIARSNIATTNVDAQLTEFAYENQDTFREYGTGMRSRMASFPEDARGTKEATWAALLYEVHQRAANGGDLKAEIKKLNESLNGKAAPAAKPATASAVARQPAQARTPSGSAGVAAPTRRPQSGGSQLNAEGRWLVDVVGMSEAEVRAMGK